MPIDLKTYASGDTDYIAKMNANVAALTTAINQLETQMGAIGGGSQLSIGMLLEALFNGADALIGPDSYKPVASGTTLNVAPGGAYVNATQTVVASFSTRPLNFSGKPAGTYYIRVDPAGIPAAVDTQEPGSMYSVGWSGGGFGPAIKIAPVFFDTKEAEASRDSEALNTKYTTLDARLEVGESLAVEAATNAESALAVAYELQMQMGGVLIRKVGCTVDGSNGVKGAIQIDFTGEIVGWSCIADQVGNLQIEVSRKASAAPPSAPAIPNTTTDKISMTPIQLTGAQSASADAAGVSTWDTVLNQWDVLQFQVVSVGTITKATVYLRIQEATPSP